MGGGGSNGGLVGVKSVYEILASSARKFPKNTAFINLCESRADAWSYEELAIALDFLAPELERNLEANKVVRGDRVAIQSFNTEVMLAYLALSRIGRATMFFNPMMPQERVEKSCEQFGVKTLIKKDLLSWLVEKETSSQIDNISFKTYPDTTQAILFSSGTTGSPKGVELTTENVYWNSYYAMKLCGMTSEDRLLCCLPLSHCFGLNFITTAGLMAGASIVMHDKFDLDKVVDSIEEHKVTMLFGSPAVFKMFLNKNIDPKRLESVRYYFYAADALAPEYIKEWHKRYGKWIETGWGLTETSPFATSNHHSIYKLGSVGKAIPGVSIKVVGSDGNSLPSGCVGEVCVWGHNVMKGYLDNPEATHEAIDKDGWFHTGDSGYLDEDGYLWLTGRTKDMINVGGEKAWPSVVEQIIEQHPMVKEAAVVGIPNLKMGEVPAAVVVLHKYLAPASDIERAAEGIIKKFLEGNLMPHEVTQTILFSKEPLPRNASGKLLREEIKQKFFSKFIERK
jgi:long-chain acyl-CoA synthetase